MKRKKSMRKQSKRPLKKLIQANITPAMKKRAKQSGGITLKVVSKRTGKVKPKADSRRKALPPGWRLSRNGKVYRETRKNRSDTAGKRI